LLSDWHASSVAQEGCSHVSAEQHAPNVVHLPVQFNIEVDFRLW
jgi:hypothetical protein